MKKFPTPYNLQKFYKNNPTIVDLVNSNLIRRGDHLTFDLDDPPSEDAEILGYTHLIYHDRELTRKEWALKIKRIVIFLRAITFSIERRDYL